MKHLLISLFALLAFAQVGNAQDSGLNIGYSNGEMGSFPSTADEYFSAISVKKQVWTRGAIQLKPERIKALEGNQIREIRACLSSKLNVDSVVVWISESLDGPVLSSDTIPTAYKAWTRYGLTHPVDITSDTKTLYIGYSYHQKSTCKALCCIKNPVPGYSCFVRSGDEEWRDCSDTYALCVEAVVFGDNLPKYDLALEALDVQKNFVVDNGTLDLNLQVRNNATMTINGFDVVCAIDGIDEQYTVHCDSILAYNEVKTIPVTIRPEAIQTMDPDHRTISVTIANLTGGEDEIPSDNTLSGTFNVTLHSYLRNVLLEEFTTEKCTNCPRVGGYVHDALENEEFKGRLNTMESHVGYYTDSFTAAYHNDWVWFYDNEYAPAVMYDRHAEDGAITAVSCPGSKQELFQKITKRLAETAFVSLKIKADVNKDTQKIHVTVTGSRAKENFTINPPRITVVLTETNLKAISQAGAGDDYYHYNVGRRVNCSWGDVLEWEGDDYTYECDIPYTQNYVMDNLGILAFVHDYDANDKTKCEVANSAAITSAEFKEVTEGISTVEAKADTNAEYYDISGRQLSVPQKGLNIIVSNGKSTKLMVK